MNRINNYGCLNGSHVNKIIYLLPMTFGVGLAHAELPADSIMKGDTIILRSRTDKLTGLSPDDAEKVAAPRTQFKVTNERDDAGKKIVVLSVTDVPCTINNSDSKVAVSTAILQTASNIQTSEADCKQAGGSLVKVGRVYKINKDDLEDIGYRRIGWIYGGIIIPYKYFSHDKSLEPGATIGPFVGYRIGETGLGVSLIAMYAVSDIKIKVVDGQQLKDRSFMGISRGVGLMFDLGKSADPFRFGVMWGKDRVGSNNTEVYPHDGKTWMAVQLGWEFGR